MTVRFCLRNYTDSKGESMVLCEYSHKGKYTRIPTGVKIDKKYWLEQKARRSHPRSKQINLKLWNLENAVMKAALSLEDPTPENVRRVLDTSEDKTNTFFGAWEKFRREKLHGYEWNTYKRYNTTLNNLKELDKEIKGGISLMAMNAEFEAKFRNLLRRKGNHSNTINRKLKDVKTFLNYCLKNGWIEDDSFQKWEVKIKPTEGKISISDEELDKIYCHNYKTNYHRKVADLFRFHAETGLRYSDAQSGKLQIIDGILHFENVKGKRSGSVKMTKIALEIWNKYKGIPKITNQKFNQFIKEAAKLAGIDSGVYLDGKLIPKCELISTHDGRATFITRLLNKGVPLHMVSKIVGHKSIKTTMKYERITQSTLYDYIGVLD